MFAVLLVIVVCYGIYLSIKAIQGTFISEAYEATVDMIILFVILVLCAIYIYLTHSQTILIINL